MTSADKDRVVGEPAEALRWAIEIATQLRDAMVGQHAAAGHALAVHTQGEDCSWCVRAADECDGAYACEDWKAWQAQYEAALSVPFAAVLGRWADELDAARSTDPGPAPTSAADPLERLVPCDGCRAIVDRWQRKAATEGLDAARPPALLRDAACRECGGTPLQLPAPATYALPAEPPPEVTELWDHKGRRWERSQPRDGVTSWACTNRPDVAEYSGWPWFGLLDTLGPLSSVPPGTEADQ